MLHSQAIPQYEERSENWHRFIYKSSIGSAKAQDMLLSADMAYMVALTGNSDAPNTMPLVDYVPILRGHFSAQPPRATGTDLVELGFNNNWFPHRFVTSLKPRNDSQAYQAIWSQRRTLEWTDLVNDAALFCVDHWSVDDYLKCIDTSNGLDFNSREIVAGMLYLSLTWPESQEIGP